MSDAAAEITQEEMAAAEPKRREGWLAGGGVAGAVLASSCCIAPLVLVTLGISGAWIGNLTALAPYKPYFIALTLVFLGLGFRQVYFRPKAACAVGAGCARPMSSVITRSALWGATVLVLLSATITWWAPLFY